MRVALETIVNVSRRSWKLRWLVDVVFLVRYSLLFCCFIRLCIHMTSLLHLTIKTADQSPTVQHRSDRRSSHETNIPLYNKHVAPSRVTDPEHLNVGVLVARTPIQRCARQLLVTFLLATVNHFFPQASRLSPCACAAPITPITKETTPQVHKWTEKIAYQHLPCLPARV
jgi:hypothetical protein